VLIDKLEESWWESVGQKARDFLPSIWTPVWSNCMVWYPRSENYDLVWGSLSRALSTVDYIRS